MGVDDANERVTCTLIFRAPSALGSLCTAYALALNEQCNIAVARERHRRDHARDMKLTRLRKALGAELPKFVERPSMLLNDFFPAFGAKSPPAKLAIAQIHLRNSRARAHARDRAETSSTRTTSQPCTRRCGLIRFPSKVGTCVSTSFPLAAAPANKFITSFIKDYILTVSYVRSRAQARARAVPE